MVRQAQASQNDVGSDKRLVPGLFNSVSIFLALLAKYAGRLSRKHRTEPGHSTRPPLARPKYLFTNRSNKTLPFSHKKKAGEELKLEPEEQGYGDGGVWQRAILMGDKCQPLDFSGVIYYDNDGKQLPELPPRSPRASPLPSYVYSK